MVNNCVTIWAHRAQINQWIDFVLDLDLGQRLEMVNMNETGKLIPVNGSKIETTEDARRTLMGLAFKDSLAAALIGVD